MDLEQWTGRYRRLTQELAEARMLQPAPARLVERLEQEIAEAEQAIVVAASATVQASPGTPRSRRTPSRRASPASPALHVEEPASE